MVTLTLRSPDKQLNLTHLQMALPQLLETARREQWTYETMVERALGAELDGREQKATARRLKAARIPSKKTVEGFDFSFQPSLSERRIRELADCPLCGPAPCGLSRPSGNGKTHLSLALANRHWQRDTASCLRRWRNWLSPWSASHPVSCVSACGATSHPVCSSLMRWATPGSR
nr:ATP-binding protein [Dictyobacter vulcani]